MASAAACTSMKSNYYLNEALNCKNTKLLNPLNLIKDEQSGEIRVKELTSLHVASIMGNMLTVKELLKQAKVLLSPEQYKLFVNVKVARELGGNNALLYACNSRNSNFILVDFLINEAGSDPNTMNDYAVNCLLIATKKSQLNILDLLLKTGVDIGFVDRNGNNALHIASAAGYADIVEMILLYWSKSKMQAHKNGNTEGSSFGIDCVDNSETTSLMKASINGHLKIIELLLRFGASPRQCNNRGESALTLACMQENYAICERLLIAKGEVNHIDPTGRTPLLKAARHNSKPEIL